MDIFSIQATILAGELKVIIRSGIRKVPSEQIPVLTNILVPRHNKVTARSAELHQLQGVIEFAAQSVLTSSELKAFKFLINSEGTNEDVTTREENAAESLGKSIQAFKKTGRPRIVEKVADNLSRLCFFIKSDDEAKMDSAIITSGAGAFDPALRELIKIGSVNAFEFLLENPARLRRGFNYDIEIDMLTKSLPGTMKVVTTYSNIRTMPDSEKYAVCICRKYQEELLPSLQDVSIIGLEIAELKPDSWQALIESGNINASLWLNERECELSRAPDVTADYIIYTFAAETLLNKNSVKVEVSTSFAIDQSIRRFPVKFTNHFTIDGITIALTIRAEPGTIKSLEYADYFSGFDGEQIETIKKRHVKAPKINVKGNRIERRIEVGPKVLVWPGAGVEFFWET